MGNFDPDAFLERTKSAHSVGGGFDPDAFLAKNTTVAAAPPVEPGSDVPPVAPEDDANSIHSYVNSGLHAAGKGFTFGLGDEAQGWGAAATTPIVNAIQGQPVWQGFGQLLKEYRGARDSARATDAQAAADHPWLSTGVELAAGLPAAIASGGLAGGAEGLGVGQKALRLMGVGAGQGGLFGFGNSDADLTSGKIGDVARVSGDTALGATTGALAARFPKIAGAALGVTGVATGNPVLAGAGFLGSASGLMGKLGNPFARWSQNAAEEALAKPREQVQALSAAAEAAAGKNQIAAGTADAAAQRAEARAQNELLAQAKQREAVAARRNADYQKGLAKPPVAPGAAPGAEGEIGTEPTRINPVMQALGDLSDQEAGLPARVAAKRAAEFGAVGGRLKSYRELVGEELPPELQPLEEKIVGAFKNRTPEVLGRDPDEAAAAFEAVERAKMVAQRRRLEGKLGWNQKGAPAPGARTPQDATARIATPGERTNPGRLNPEIERAMALAKSLGLDPGDVAGFDPKAVLPLLEDPNAARYANSNQALRATADAARSKSDAAQAALERVTPQGEKALQLMQQIEDPNYVRDQGMRKLGGAALKGGAFGFIGGPHGAVGGAALGALHAAATDPAARSVLFGAVNKALLGSPALRARAGSYLVPLLSQQSGRSTAAILDAIQKDPELKRAVETAASGAGGR